MGPDFPSLELGCNCQTFKFLFLAAKHKTCPTLSNCEEAGTCLEGSIIELRIFTYQWQIPWSTLQKKSSESFSWRISHFFSKEMKLNGSCLFWKPKVKNRFTVHHKHSETDPFEHVSSVTIAYCWRGLSKWEVTCFYNNSYFHTSGNVSRFFFAISFQTPKALQDFLLPFSYLIDAFCRITRALKSQASRYIPQDRTVLFFFLHRENKLCKSGPCRNSCGKFPCLQRGQHYVVDWICWWLTLSLLENNETCNFFHNFVWVSLVTHSPAESANISTVGEHLNSLYSVASHVVNWFQRQVKNTTE